jgi:hypothetical protein
MDKETWLDDIEGLAFKSELQKLADSPIYSEETTINDEEPDLEIEDEGEGGYVYHSNDGIQMRNNQTIKHKIDKLKKKAKGRI